MKVEVGVGTNPAALYHLNIPIQRIKRMAILKTHKTLQMQSTTFGFVHLAVLKTVCNPEMTQS